jgi:rhodanese-related sulfurtransferase
MIPDKEAKIVVYCRSGRRSAEAAKVLKELGYKNVYDLGGINSWPYETISGE